MSAKHRAIGLLTFAGLVLATSAEAEISKVAPSTSDVVAPGMRLRVQCFQKGVKIVDEEQLEAVNINPVSRNNSLTFRRRGQEGVAVSVLALDETTCVLVAPR